MPVQKKYTCTGKGKVMPIYKKGKYACTLKGNCRPAHKKICPFIKRHPYLCNPYIHIYIHVVKIKIYFSRVCL